MAFAGKTLWTLWQSNLLILLFHSKETTFELGHFRTLSGHFSPNYIWKISQNLDADDHFQVLNMECLCDVFISKSYSIKHKSFYFHFFQFWKKKYCKFMSHKWPFFDHFCLFLPIAWKSWTNLRSRQLFWDA